MDKKVKTENATFNTQSMSVRTLTTHNLMPQENSMTVETLIVSNPKMTQFQAFDLGFGVAMGVASALCLATFVYWIAYKLIKFTGLFS